MRQSPDDRFFPIIPCCLSRHPARALTAAGGHADSCPCCSHQLSLAAGAACMGEGISLGHPRGEPRFLPPAICPAMLSPFDHVPGSDGGHDFQAGDAQWRAARLRAAGKQFCRPLPDGTRAETGRARKRLAATCLAHHYNPARRDKRGRVPAVARAPAVEMEGFRKTEKEAKKGLKLAATKGSFAGKPNDGNRGCRPGGAEALSGLPPAVNGWKGRTRLLDRGKWGKYNKPNSINHISKSDIPGLRHAVCLLLSHTQD